MLTTVFAGCNIKKLDGVSKTAVQGDIIIDNIVISKKIDETQEYAGHDITFGTITVYGEIQNNSADTRSLTLNITFYKGSKNHMFSASGAVNDLSSGEKRIFSAFGWGDLNGFDFDNYDIEVTNNIKTAYNNPIIEFSNISAKTTSDYTIINGEAKNTDSKNRSFTYYVGAYDANGKLIGVADGAVNNMAADSIKTFSAISSSDLSSAIEYKTYVSTVTFM